MSSEVLVMSASSRTTKDPTQALQKTLSKAMATARVQTLFVPAYR